jgi:hypothetical protein
MFRLFLVDKLAKGMSAEAHLKPASLPKRRAKNRRVFERYTIDHKHLALMNEQDILLVRDVSATGLSAEVGPRCAERLVVDDAYNCRMRYLGEVYLFKAKVAWKEKNFVGFEIFEPTALLTGFLNRLVQPIEVGLSLKQVADKFSDSLDREGMKWFQGVKNTDLFIWNDDEESLKAWELEFGKKYIKWDLLDGISTGSFTGQDLDLDLEHPWQKKKTPDSFLDKKIKQYALDIFMAIKFDKREELINTITNTE